MNIGVPGLSTVKLARSSQVRGQGGKSFPEETLVTLSVQFNNNQTLVRKQAEAGKRGQSPRSQVSHQSERKEQGQEDQEWNQVA